MKELKIVAITCNTSWGILNYRSILIKSIQEKGYRVVTIAPKDEYTHKLEALGCEHIHFELDSNSRNPLSDILLVFGYRRLFRKLKPVVVLNFTAKPNIYSTLACSICGTPSINNISGLGYGFIRENLITKVLKVLYKISLNKANFIFLQNPDDHQFFKDLKIINPTKSSVLPGSGVNLERFQKSEIPICNQNPFVFLLVARMMYSKGILTLLKAAKNVYSSGFQNFRVHLLGDHGFNNQDAIPNSILERWNREPFVKYLGKTDDVAPYFDEAHCVVLPSYYREGTPRSLLEGLAKGRPIITSNMPGCKETVVNGLNGFVVAPRNVIELAEKMKIILSLSQEELQKMGDESHKLARSKYDDQIVIDAYLSQIKKNALN